MVQIGSFRRKHPSFLLRFLLHRMRSRTGKKKGTQICAYRCSPATGELPFLPRLITRPFPTLKQFVRQSAFHLLSCKPNSLTSSWPCSSSCIITCRHTHSPYRQPWPPPCTAQRAPEAGGAPYGRFGLSTFARWGVHRGSATG